MSNCINIKHGDDIHFTPDEIDADGLENLIKTAEKEVNRSNCTDETIDWQKRVAWWFLHKTKFTKVDTIIYLQSGRSGHTWRDFDNTLALISQYVKGPKDHVFYIADEYDGFESLEKYTVNLQTAEYIE